MTAKVSPEMLKAREMIERGATAYRAAKDCGIASISSITRSQWYKDFKAANPDHSTDPAPMDRARKLVEIDGKTAYEAAKLTGVAQSSISRAPWYRAHIDNLVKEFQPGGKYGKTR